MSESTRTGTEVFTRRASGLLRVASAWDVFIFNVGLVSVGIAVALNQYYGPSLYPGVNIAGSTLLAAAGMVVVALTMYLWSTTFPRSGGVYVSLSRTLNPGTAFVLSVLETMVLMYYAAFAASLIVTVGLSSFLATVGIVSGVETFISWAAFTASPHGIFLGGTLVLVLAAALLSSGTRRYFSVQKVLFWLAVAGTAVLVGVLLFGSRDTFQSNLAQTTGLEYQEVIGAAVASGWQQSGHSWGSTVAFLVWPLLPLLGAVQSIGIGGEVKRVGRTQLRGMIGAVVAAAGLIALLAVLLNRVFGFEFQGAIAWNSLEGLQQSTDATVGAPPWFTVLAGILTGNVVLAAIIMAAFVAWIWFWIPAEIAYTTRTMIAWSFDRIAPDRLGFVSQRFNTPVVAIWLSTLFAVVFMSLIAYRNIELLTLIMVVAVVWGSAMVSAIVFPWTRRQLYRASPVSRLRIGPLPAMPIAGALSTLFLGTVLVMLWRDPIAAGPMISASGARPEFWIILSVAVVAIGWYVAAKAYRRRRGIDLEFAFKQIPIE